MQDPENNSLDPRWITLRVSRINLAITALGAVVAFPVMYLLGGIPAWMRISLLVVFALSMAWDLRLILLKGADSVGAFYLFDIDPPPPSPGMQPGQRTAAADAPRLGIRIRFANAAKHLDTERDGIVLKKAFVSPWFTVLRYRLPGDAGWRRWWPRVIPLWADSLEAAEFRRIRVALKWK